MAYCLLPVADLGGRASPGPRLDDPPLGEGPMVTENGKCIMRRVNDYFSLSLSLSPKTSCEDDSYTRLK